MACLNAGNSIPVAPLVEAFKRSGLTAGEVARRCDYWRPNSDHGRDRLVGDGTRVLRLLGLRAYSPATKTSGKPKTRVRLDLALKLCEAMDIDPYEVGL